MGIVKNILQKSTKEGLHVGLMNYRATPLACGLSPSQLLLGWTIRTKLPMTNFLETNHTRDTTEEQRKQKFCYDRTAQDLPELHVGENVRVQLERT